MRYYLLLSLIIAIYRFVKSSVKSSIFLWLRRHEVSRVGPDCLKKEAVAIIKTGERNDRMEKQKTQTRSNESCRNRAASGKDISVSATCEIVLMQ